MKRKWIYSIIAIFYCLLLAEPAANAYASAAYVHGNTTSDFGWTVGNEQNLPFYNPATDYGDGTMSFIRDGDDLWAFNPILRNGVRRWKGTNFNDLVKQPDGKLDSSWPGVNGQNLNDDTYWINTAWKGTDGKLYAAVHIEYAYPGVAHENSDSEWTWAFRKICLGSSSDHGATWHYEGEILSNANTALGDKSTYPGEFAPTGEGDPLLYIDEQGGYIYLYTYTAYYKKAMPNRDEWKHHGRALEVARSPISANGAPGSWNKFYNGAWDEPGVGGKATSVVKDSAWAAISYNTYLGKYIMIQTGGNGTNISTATDLNAQNWTTPQYFMNQVSNYLSAIDQTTDSQYVTGQNLRLVYTDLGTGKYRAISFDKGTAEAPVTTTGPSQPQRYVFQSVDNDSFMWKRDTLPFVDDKTSGITYTGNWVNVERNSAIQRTIKTTSENNATVQFSAYGTDLYIWGDTGPSGGKADVYIDGAYVDTINYYYPAVSTNAILFAQKGLSLGHHTVTIVNTGQKDDASAGTEITFDGYETAAGDVYQASAGFSSVQGTKNWSYGQRSGETYSPLTFDTSAIWPNPEYPYDFRPNDPFAFMQPALKSDRNNFFVSPSDTALRIGTDYMAPGANADAIRSWTAPRAGNVNISGTVMKKSGSENGDGVVATIVKNNAVLWGPTVIANNDVVGQNFSVNTPVAAGDRIGFILNKNGESSSDTTLWNPTIFYGIDGVVAWPPPQKELLAGNVAQGKPADDDSAQPGLLVASGNDAYRTTYWSAPDGQANHWWRVDLGNKYQLVRSEVDWEQNNAYQYKIEVSNDNVSWLTAVDKTGNAAASKVMKDDFNAVGRYVRITVTGGVSDTVRASFSEFKLYTLTSGKPVTTDSFQLRNEAPNGTDGNLSTRWAANDGKPDHWWEVDLGSIYYLTSAEVIWEKSNAYKYKIETSNDKVSWLTAVDKTGNTKASKIMTDAFNAKGRYVRITVTGGVSHSAWAGFYEFNLFGMPFSGNNVAQGKAATADVAQTVNKAVYGNDNSLLTRWSATDVQANHWWKVDLGSSYSLTGSEINWEKSNAYQYKIEVSDDDVNWITALDQTGNKNASKVMANSFQASGRYVRLTVTGGLSTFYWASFFDIQLFADGIAGAVTGIQLDQAVLALAEGDTAELNAAVQPSNAANKQVSWSSSDATVAKVEVVSGKAVVTGLQAGTADITATTAEGGFQAKAQVTVTAHSLTPGTTVTGPVSVLAGQTFTAQLGVRGVTESVYAQDWKVTYDSSVMAFVSAVSVHDGVKLMQSVEGTPGSLRFILASEGSGHAMTGSTNVLQLTFRAGSHPTPGTGRIAVEEAILGNAEGHETSAALASVHVAVATSPVATGDVNGDNAVSIGDLAMIAASYGKNASSADWPLVKRGDLTGDEIIDLEDLVRVAVLLIE